MTILRYLLAAALVLAAVAKMPAAAASDTLARVHASGTLACGILTEPEDYTTDDTHGPLDGFGAELCRAFAAATLGDAGKARLVPMPDEQGGLEAVRDGALDVMATATPAVTAQVAFGVLFAPPVFYDGQGFLVARGSGIRSLADLGGKQVCFIGSTAHTAVLTSAASRDGVPIVPFPFEEVGEMEAALIGGHCAAMTGDVSFLADARARFRSLARGYEIVPERLTLDPVAPATRQDDPRWAMIVASASSALMQAEALGITRANVAARAADADPVTRRLLGGDPAAGRALGLRDDWVVAMIGAVGNYGEIYDRTLGALGVARGLNRPWTRGGALAPPPLR